SNTIAPAIRERPGLRAISFSEVWLNGSLVDSLLRLKGLTCLNLTYAFISNELLSLIAEKALPLRSLILQDCFGYNYVGLFNLLSKCKKIQYLDLQRAKFLKDQDVFKLSSFLGDLVYINISKCCSLTNFALFALLWKDINMFASVFPNLQLLDLSFSDDISEDGLKLFKTNIEIFMLEALNLSHTRVDDETLHVISTSCFRLMQLDLGHCYDVTEKGVMQVLKNCAQLREINLQDCGKVSVDSMVLRRPSLRKITTPPGFCCSDSKRELFLLLGCLVC
ncbi:F-box/LRR-repeat protein, partial [Trifolium pratense]